MSALFIGSLCAVSSYAETDGKVILTPAEELWLKSNQSRLVAAVETGYPPFVFLDSQGKQAGLANDYLLAVEEKLGVRFNRKEFHTLEEILAAARRGEVHLVNAVSKTPRRSEFLSFTKPFVSVPNVILVRKERALSMTEKNLLGLKVSLVKSYAVTERLTTAEPGMEIDLVPDDLTAILNVSFGRSDAAVVDLATASYLISQKGITNLRVAGEASSGIDLAMAVPKSAAPLQDILQKGLDAVPADERERIRERWIRASRESIVTHEALIALAAVVVGIVGVMTAVLLWNRTLRRLVAARTADLAREKEALQQSENYHRSILETATDGIWLVDTRGRLLEVNAAYCRMSGYSEAELLEMHVGDVEAVESPQATAERIRQIMETGQASFESRHRRKDGSTYCVEVRAQRFSSQKGTMVAFLRDISDRKAAESVLVEREARYRQLVDSLQNAVVYQITGTADGERKFTYISRAVERINECSVEEVLADAGVIYRQMLPEYAGLVRDLEAEALKNLAPLHVEVQSRLPSGRVRWLEFSSVPRLRSDGQWIWDGIETDVTERKESEQKRLLLEQQLLQAQKLESIGRLAGGVAHDFNNMLGVILGHAEIGMMWTMWRSPGDRVCEHLREIKVAAERSAELTRQLLAFARKQIIEPKVLDLNRSVPQMLKLLQRLIGESIRLDWQPAPEAWLVRMDPSQVDQILANLCVNARDAIASTGTITLSVENRVVDSSHSAENSEAVPGEYVCLMVSDDGAGMDQETVSRIFEPFFTTKDVGKGTGLGLATVYGAVRQNRGFIEISSRPGAGTTFHLYLPRHLHEPSLGTAEPSSPPPGGKETILLVEDEEGILRVSTDMLEIQGYQVLPASTPVEARQLARDYEGIIDLLITDVIMPGSNGSQLAHELAGIRPGMKRLFMSGYSSDIISEHGVVAEGVQFIQKPFTIPALSAKVREVLDGSAPC